MTRSTLQARWRGGAVVPLPAANGGITAEQATADTRTFAGGQVQLLDPAVIRLRQVTGSLATAALGTASLAVLLINVLSSEPTTRGVLASAAFWLAGVALLAWFTYRWPVIDYNHASYRLDELGIEIRRGVLWRTIVNIPRSRIQHTDVSQGPLERRYGLGTLVVYTAGTDYARVSLSGLHHVTALHIREHLLPTEDGGAV